MAIVEVHFRHVKQRAIDKITPQRGGIGGFANQVEFIKDGFFKFSHHLARPQALAVIKRPFNQLGHHVQQADILFYRGANVRAQYFYRDVAARFAA